MSFVQQLSQWVRRALGPELKANINRLINRELRRSLLDAVRGPVLGTRGEAGLATTVVPEPPTEPSTEGLYGHPYPGNPHPDPGALWFESGGSWTGLFYPDWDADFPHPPGVQAGNVFFENRNTKHVISWHWYPTGGGPGNAIKYLQDSADFTAWAQEEQAGDPGGGLSRDILHMGKRLYLLPDFWACIGACVADDWLLFVAFNLPGQQTEWIWSGYDVDPSGSCGAATTNSFFVQENPLAMPDTIFPPNTWVRVGTEYKRVQTITQVGGAGCWEIVIIGSFSYVPVAGTPIELDGFGLIPTASTTRVFAVPTVTNADGDLEVVPGSTLHAIEDLVELEWTQQFLAHPDGRNMMSMIRVGSATEKRGIHRLAFNTTATPPTVVHTIENLTTLRDEIRVESIDVPRFVHDCYDTGIVPGQQEALAISDSCYSCPNDSSPTTFEVAYDRIFSGEDTRTSHFDIEESIGRKVRDQFKSYTVAVDYGPNGDELIATIEVDFQSIITTRTTHNYSFSDSWSGTLSISPYCVAPEGPIFFTNSGRRDDIVAWNSSLVAERHLQTNLTVDLAVNGLKKFSLGSSTEDTKWTNTSDTKSAYRTQTSWVECDSWQSVPLNLIPGRPVCGNPENGDITNYSMASGFFGETVYDEAGTLIDPVDCADVLNFNYDQYPTEPVAHDIRHIASPLLFLDLRAGVYVTQGREGIVDDIYSLVASKLDPDSLRQMYCYTVEDTNFIPSKPAQPDRINYDQHRTAWGADFVEQASVNSPAPTWLAISQIDKKISVTNPVNWKFTDFIKTDDPTRVVQGSAKRDGKILVNVFVELPTAGQETLQAVELLHPAGDPLGLINIPLADKIANIGAV